MNTSPARTIGVTRARMRSTAAADELTRTWSPDRTPSGGGVGRVDLDPRLRGEALEERHPARLGAGVPVLDGAAGVEHERELGANGVADRLGPTDRACRPRPPGRWKPPSV